MKKFTWIIALSMTTVMAHSESKNDQQTRLNESLRKYIQTVQKTKLLLKSNNTSEFRNVNESLSDYSIATHKLDSAVSQKLNRQTNQWENDWKDVYDYNNEMKHTMVWENEWDQNASLWSNWTKTEIGYDTLGNIEYLGVSYRADESPTLYLFDLMYVYYNSVGNPDSVLSYYATSPQEWELQSKLIYSYNHKGQLSSLEFWELSGLENEEEMTKSLKMIYTYDESDNMITSSSYYVTVDPDLLYSRSEHSYNSSGKLITTKVSSLSFFSGEMENNNRSVYDYNVNGDLAHEIYSDWSGNDETWIERNKYEYSYGSLNFSDAIIPTYQNIIYGMKDRFMIPFNKLVIETTTYDMINGSWVNTEKTTYHYSITLATGVKDYTTISVLVYPNPVHENLTIQWNGIYNELTFDLYHLNVSKVSEQIIYPGKTISIANLVNGIYLLKLNDGKQQVYTSKLVKN